MSKPRMTWKHIKEIEATIEERRAAILQAITTQEEFRQALTPVVEAANADPTNFQPILKMQRILLRGHQILSPDEFWETLDAAGIKRQDALELVNDAIQKGTAHAVSAPFFDYLDELMRRAKKLAREMKAGKYDQQMFRLRFAALYQEFIIMSDEWDKQQPPPPFSAKKFFSSSVFGRLATWFQDDNKDGEQPSADSPEQLRWRMKLWGLDQVELSSLLDSSVPDEDNDDKPQP